MVPPHQWQTRDRGSASWLSACTRRGRAACQKPVTLQKGAEVKSFASIKDAIAFLHLTYLQWSRNFQRGKIPVRGWYNPAFGEPTAHNLAAAAAREQQRSTPNSGAGAGHSSRGKKRDATTYSGRRTEIVLRKNTATKKFVSIKDALVFLNVSYDTFARVHQVKRRLMF